MRNFKVINMTWRDIVKREAFKVSPHYDRLNQRKTMTVNQAHEEAHKIMVKRHGKDYDEKSWASAERNQLFNLMYYHGQTPAMAAKQPFIEPEEDDPSEGWRSNPIHRQTGKSKSKDNDIGPLGF